MEFQDNIEKKLDCSDADDMCLERYDVEKEILLGYPYNFSMKYGNEIIGHLRLNPLEGLQVTVLIVTMEHLMLGCRLLRFAFNFAYQKDYKRLWSIINKNNTKVLKVMERMARIMGMKENDYLKDINERYYLAEYLYV